MWKIKLLAKLIWAWDVVFTAIDLWQLRFYVKMRSKLAELLRDYHNLSKNKNLQDFDSWEDVK